MKRLILIFLFSGSLDSFSQESKTLEYPPKVVEARIYKRPDFRIDTVNHRTPDTLRAICLVTMCRRCAAEPMPGFVVIEQGKRPVYLDCRKRAFKYPQVGWGYVEVNPNKEK